MLYYLFIKVIDKKTINLTYFENIFQRELLIKKKEKFAIKDCYAVFLFL